ncbi:unnamed protein product [Ectocarpus sp. 12 AP-2014]
MKSVAYCMRVDAISVTMRLLWARGSRSATSNDIPRARRSLPRRLPLRLRRARKPSTRRRPPTRRSHPESLPPRLPNAKDARTTRYRH